MPGYAIKLFEKCFHEVVQVYYGINPTINTGLIRTSFDLCHSVVRQRWILYTWPLEQPQNFSPTNTFHAWGVDASTEPAAWPGTGNGYQNKKGVAMLSDYSVVKKTYQYQISGV